MVEIFGKKQPTPARLEKVEPQKEICIRIEELLVRISAILFIILILLLFFTICCILVPPTQGFYWW